MKLTSILVQNHSRVNDFRIEVRDHLVLVGTNESGKSSILRCLDLMLGTPTAQLYAKITPADVRDHRHPFIVEVELSNTGDAKTPQFAEHIRLRLTARVDADGETMHIERGEVGEHARALTTRQLEQLGWIYLSDSFAEKNETRSRNIVDELLENADLDHEKNSFVEQSERLSGMLESSPSLFELRKRIARVLTTALPGQYNPNNLVFEPGSKLTGNPFSDVHLQLRMHGEQRELWAQSGGMRSIYNVAMVDLLNSRTQIIGMDEPETHLHPTSQRNLARLLKEGGSQKIIATHSPDIIGEFEPDQIVVARAEGGVVQPRRDFLSKDDKLLLHMWVRDRLEPLTAEHVIVVEGVTDRALVEHCADVTGRNLDTYGIVLLEAGGCGEMPSWRRVFGERGFQVPLSQLIDEDAQDAMSRQYGVPVERLEERGVWVSHKDLEDEYVRALGADAALEALTSGGLFNASELRPLRAARSAGVLSDDQVADFCRIRSHKTRAVLSVIPHINAKVARRIGSIESMLSTVIDAHRRLTRMN